MKLRAFRDQQLTELTARLDEPVRTAITRMNAAGLRLMPVADAAGRFAGVLADGDVRRLLSTGGDVDSPVSTAVNRNPVTVNKELSESEIRSAMIRRGVEYLPVVIDGRVTVLYSLWIAPAARELTAVIMAGGLGQRLAPLTDTCPKPLLDIGGKPILSHIIEHLRDSGVNRFILSVNYLADQIIDHFGDGSELNVSINYVRESIRLGTGGALSLLEPDTLSDPFLCLNGDLLNDLDVESLLAAHQEHSWDATMVTRTHGYTVPYGVVRVDNSGAFIGADEKPTMEFLINSGIYMLSKSVLSRVPHQKFYDMPTLFEDLRAAGGLVGTFNHAGRWIDIGNLADLNRARKIFDETA